MNNMISDNTPQILLAPCTYEWKKDRPDLGNKMSYQWRNFIKEAVHDTLEIL